MELKKALTKFFDKVDLKTIDEKTLIKQMVDSGLFTVGPLAMKEQSPAYYDVKSVDNGGNVVVNTCGIYNNVCEAFGRATEFCPEGYADVTIHKLTQKEVSQRAEEYRGKMKEEDPNDRGNIYTYLDKFYKNKKKEVR